MKQPKRTLDSWGEKEAINVTSEAEDLAFRELMDKAGRTWSSGHAYISDHILSSFGAYKEEAVYFADGTKSDKEYANYIGYTVSPAADFLPQQSQLPQHFIFRNDGSEAFNKCLDWMNKTYLPDYTPWYAGTHGFIWYGHDGNDFDVTCGGCNGFNDPNGFGGHPVCYDNPADLWALIEAEQQEEPAQGYKVESHGVVFSEHTPTESAKEPLTLRFKTEAELIAEGWTKTNRYNTGYTFCHKRGGYTVADSVIGELGGAAPSTLQSSRIRLGFRLLPPPPPCLPSRQNGFLSEGIW